MEQAFGQVAAAVGAQTDAGQAAASSNAGQAAAAVGAQTDDVGSRAAASASDRGTIGSSGLQLQEFRGKKLVDGESILRKDGYDLGNSVTSKASPDKAWVIWDVLEYHDGEFEVVLREEGADEMKREKLDTFAKEFKLKDAKNFEVKHPKWPANQAGMGKLHLTMVTKCRIQTALHLVGMAVAERIDLTTALALLSKPQRSVKSLMEVKKGQLALTPHSMKIVSVTGKESPPEGSVEVLFKTGALEVPGTRFYVPPSCSDEFLCPAWAVRVTHDQKQANMTWVSTTISDIAVVDTKSIQYNGRLTQKTNSSESAEYQILIPVLVNSKPLAPSTELLVFRPAPPKKQKSTAVKASSLLPLPAAKKAKQ